MMNLRNAASVAGAMSLIAAVIAVGSPSPALAASPPACKASAPSNPFGYDFCAGRLVYSPAGNVCDYFNCIPSFWRQTNGYLEECRDGTYSHSGGRPGACSFHGGERQSVYAH